MCSVRAEQAETCDRLSIKPTIYLHSHRLFRPATLRAFRGTFIGHCFRGRRRPTQLAGIEIASQNTGNRHDIVKRMLRE